jgi:(+)-pinoresinol hydroxylase
LKSIKFLLVVPILAGAGTALAADSSVETGRQVYQKWCTPCHGAGPGKPATTLMAAQYKGSKPAVLEERTDLTAPLIKGVVRNGILIMPRFRKTEISNSELDGIVAYLTRKER